MDPKANLQEQLRISQEIQRVWDNCNPDGTLTMSQQDHVATLSGRLSELVIALDEWMREGGFSPWQS